MRKPNVIRSKNKTRSRKKFYRKKGGGEDVEQKDKAFIPHGVFTSSFYITIDSKEKSLGVTVNGNYISVIIKPKDDETIYAVISGFFNQYYKLSNFSVNSKTLTYSGSKDKISNNTIVLTVGKDAQLLDDKNDKESLIIKKLSDWKSFEQIKDAAAIGVVGEALDAASTADSVSNCSIC